jgi:hypothetical protein
MHCIIATVSGEFGQVLHILNTVTTLQIEYGHQTSTGNLKSQYLDNWGQGFQEYYGRTKS